jgi:hypothetical protein
MTNEKLSFLDDKPADKTEVKEEAKATPEAKVETQPVITEVIPAVVEPVAEPKGDGHTVPLPKYLDTYNENRELKKRIGEFEAKSREKAPLPDPMTDPEGYAQYQTQAVEERIFNQKLDMSEEMAIDRHGKDAVDVAFEAMKAKNDQFAYQQVMSSRHPFDALVKWHKREKLLSDIGDKPDEYVMRRYQELTAAQAAAAGQAPIVQTQTATPVIPAASLTRAPAGKKPSEVAIGAGNAFDATFAR